MKISEKWKRPFRLALVLLLLVIVFIQNNWGFDFKISLHLKSVPIEREIPDDDSRQTALRTQVTIEDPVIRYRDRPA